ncbi:MAG: hypothetical protein JJE05_03095 [Actinobacteria bacterium]|nr:hypothetical protein [Actinomycetota bacterium]
MTDEVATWLIAAWQTITALGIAAFWLTWFREEHAEPWLPEGYVEHERVFVFPDSVLSLLLIASAVLQIAEEPLGGSLALLCAGMLTFLGVIDAAYFAQHGMFARNRGGVINGGIIASTLALAVVLVVRFA